MEKKKCEFCATEYWEPPGGHECFSVPNQLLAELFHRMGAEDPQMQDITKRYKMSMKAWPILAEIERMLKKSGE